MMQARETAAEDTSKAVVIDVTKHGLSKVGSLHVPLCAVPQPHMPCDGHTGLALDSVHPATIMLIVS